MKGELPMSDQGHMDELFAIMKIAKTQQEAVQAAIAGLEAERAAIARDRAALTQAATSVSSAAGEVKQAAMRAVPALQKDAGGAIEAGFRGFMVQASEAAVSTLSAGASPILRQIADVVKSADEAEDRLSRSMSTFGWKWAALAGGAAAGCVAAVLLAAWLTAWWQRGQVEKLDEQRAELENTVAELEANVATMANKGGRIKVNICTDSAGAERLCIPVARNQGKGYEQYTAPFANTTTGEQFVIPKGY
jgi:hypothetical protein